MSDQNRVANNETLPPCPVCGDDEHAADVLTIHDENYEGEVVECTICHSQIPTEALKRVATNRQKKVLAWAIENFGAIATNRDERAARLVEEAIEVAQAEGLPLHILQKISERVYARPAGKLAQEIGGLAITLDALAENAGLSVQAESAREWARVLSLPKDWWARRHAEKVAAGVADLSVSKSVSGD